MSRIEDVVKIHKRGAACWLTINRPERRNALNAEVIAGLAAAYRQCEADAENRVVVLTGAGHKAFCAGADLQSADTHSQDERVPTTAFADLLRLFHGSNIPTIARINGACVAGGMGLLCMTDLAVAVDDATFGLPEATIGLFPVQVLALLKDMVAPRVLRRWCLTGQPFGAQAALAVGLIDEIAPRDDLDDRVDRLVAQIAANSPSALRRGKYAMRAMESSPFEVSLAFAEAQFRLLLTTEDAREGLASFREKRDPKWSKS